MSSWKPEVRTGRDPKFYGNNLAFATREEAEKSASSLMARWFLVEEWRVVESDQTVNYRMREDGAIEGVGTDIGEGPPLNPQPVEETKP